MLRHTLSIIQPCMGWMVTLSLPVTEPNVAIFVTVNIYLYIILYILFIYEKKQPYFFKSLYFPFLCYVCCSFWGVIPAV